MTSCLRFTLTLWSIVGAASAASPPLWGGLESGPSAVGFKVLRKSDPSRPLQGGAARPIQISLWYPAAASDGPRLTYRDYFVLSADELLAQPASPDEERKALAGFEGFLASVKVPAAVAERWLAEPMAASRDAPAASGKHPLLLIALGNGQSAHDQAVLGEYVASHGFAVATCPSQTRIGGAMQSESQIAANAEAQAADLAFVAQELRETVDAERIGVIGDSFGARSALLFAMADAKVRALVSLDGGIGTATGARVFAASRLFNADRARAPILHFYEEADPFMKPDFGLLRSLDRSERWLIRMGGLHHVHFTILGEAAAIFPELGAATHTVDGTRAAYEQVLDAARRFAARYVAVSGGAFAVAPAPHAANGILAIERLQATPR